MSTQIIHIVAFKLGESIQIDRLQKAYVGEVYSSSPFEVFFRLNQYSFIYVHRNGEVACSDCDEMTINNFIDFSTQYIGNAVSDITTVCKECFKIEFCVESPLVFKCNSVQLPILDPGVIRLVLLNIIQSVSLHDFTQRVSDILLKTTNLSKELEKRGRLKISKSNLMNLLGSVLNLQNQFVDSVYNMNEPKNTWEDEYLLLLNEGLSKTFRLKKRYKKVDHALKNIDLSLKTFAQIVQHRENYRMEWVIITLIFLELLNIIVGRHN